MVRRNFAPGGVHVQETHEHVDFPFPSRRAFRRARTGVLDIVLNALSDQSDSGIAYHHDARLDGSIVCEVHLRAGNVAGIPG